MGPRKWITRVSHIVFGISTATMLLVGANKLCCQSPEKVELLSWLSNYEQAELLSVNPRQIPYNEIKAGRENSVVYDYEVLGACLLEREEAKKLTGVLQQGLSFHFGLSSTSFYPRYGLRLTKGKQKLEILLSFRDRWLKPGENLIPITPVGENAFHEAVTSHHLPTEASPGSPRPH